MDKNWVIIYSSYNSNELEILRSFLIDNDIESIILNKQDSMYVNLNTVSPVELYVHKNNFIKAKYLIDKHYN